MPSALATASIDTSASASSAPAALRTRATSSGSALTRARFVGIGSHVESIRARDEPRGRDTHEGVSAHPFDRPTEADLRRRQSAKWKLYPEDVLPVWVAEMDFPIAEPVRRVLHEAIDLDDAGYADPRGLGAAFAPFAKATWNWRVDPHDVRVAPDVVTSIAELLRVVTRPGDGVVIDTPVYPPFASTIRASERAVVDTPLGRTQDGGFAIDLEAIERAYAAGAKAHILCSPHNPTGIVYERRDLVRIAELAARHGVIVISDEIHAPLTHREAAHVPFPMVSELAARQAIVVTSASKAWNFAGLKASVVVACADETRALLADLPPEMPYHAGHLGVLAARAAFAHGGEWLRTAMEVLDRNRVLLQELLAEHLPAVKYRPPSAGYLAWLDCSALGIQGDPARVFLERGRVALSSGPSFGAQGTGFARLNFATTRALLEEAVRRMARAVATRA